MIGVNELTEAGCHERLFCSHWLPCLSPYAPHLAEELWGRGGEGSVVDATWPEVGRGQAG